MKALLCKTHGLPDTLVLEEVASKPLGKGEVRVRVRAAGVNFPDVLIIQNKYQFKPELPFSPGGECAGDVIEVAAGVTGVAVGDRVICMTGWGAFAEEVTIGAEKIQKMPASMDYPTGAAFLMTYGTSHHALRQRAAIKPGESLLVLGAAGGVGLAAVELGKVMGAKVIAAASTDAKLDVARKFGAEHGINYGTEKLRDKLKAIVPDGVDVVYDPVGGELAEQALRSTAWEGRFLVVGFAAGPIPSIPLNLVLLKGCQVVGVFWGDFTRREPKLHKENLAELMRWFDEGKLHPHISATYPLAKGAEAINALMNRQATGKVVITM